MAKDNYTYPGDPPEQEYEPDTLIIADQSLRLGFIQLPKLVLYARNITRDAKLLYAILLGYAWQEQRCFPGYARLCYDMGASENTVRTYMRELEGVGLLQQKRRGLGKTNIYTLTDLRTSKIEVQEPQPPRTSKIEVQEPAKIAVAEPAETAAYKETEEKESREKEPDQYSNYRNTGGLHKIKRDPQRYEQFRLRTNVDNSRAAREADMPDSEPASTGMAKLAEVLAQRDLLKSGPAEPYATRRGRPPKVPEYLAATMADLSQKLHDDNPRSSVTQATRLWKASGLPEDKFVHRLHEARSITQQQGSVKGKPAKEDRQLVNRMPYFFAVVEDLLGLKGSAADPS